MIIIWIKIKRNISIFILICLYSALFINFRILFRSWSFQFRNVSLIQWRLLFQRVYMSRKSSLVFHQLHFILFFFWHDKFSMLFCEKDNKFTWAQSYVALPLMIKFLKLLFWNNFASNFNLLNFVLLFRFWFSDSCASEESFSFEFYFYCYYSVSVVFNLLFLFFVYRI